MVIIAFIIWVSIWALVGYFTVRTIQMNRAKRLIAAYEVERIKQQQELVNNYKVY